MRYVLFQARKAMIDEESEDDDRPDDLSSDSSEDPGTVQLYFADFGMQGGLSLTEQHAAFNFDESLAYHIIFIKIPQIAQYVVMSYSKASNFWVLVN
jgi:hypothetical protein